MMSLETLIGSAAAALTTLCFVPQVLLVLHKRRTEGISLLMYLIFAVGITLWLIYGLMLGSLPIILANGITLPLVIIIIIMKIRLG